MPLASCLWQFFRRYEQFSGASLSMKEGSIFIGWMQRIVKRMEKKDCMGREETLFIEL